MMPLVLDKTFLVFIEANQTLEVRRTFYQADLKNACTFLSI